MVYFSKLNMLNTEPKCRVCQKKILKSEKCIVLFAAKGNYNLYLDCVGKEIFLHQKCIADKLSDLSAVLGIGKKDPSLFDKLAASIPNVDLTKLIYVINLNEGDDAGEIIKKYYQS